MTMKQLGGAIGGRHQQISAYERGIRKAVTDETLIRLCRVLSCTPADLMKPLIV